MREWQHFFLLMLIIAGIIVAGCSTTNGDDSNKPENTAIPTSIPETTLIAASESIPCGTSYCKAAEECCNGFCIDPEVYCCCGGKPCQGSCCNVSGTERCYDPGKQSCCENTLCDVGGCCAGTCIGAGQYYCVYVNGTGCYGLPDHIKCSWKEGFYKLYWANVLYGEPEPAYMDIIIEPATGDRSKISEYWIIPAVGGGAAKPEQRVREG